MRVNHFATLRLSQLILERELLAPELLVQVLE
jgi:hypothetical protein